MATASKPDTAHITALRTLCEQALELRKAADELCQRLTKRIEASRASVLNAQKPERRKLRKHR